MKKLTQDGVLVSGRVSFCSLNGNHYIIGLQEHSVHFIAPSEREIAQGVSEIIIPDKQLPTSLSYPKSLVTSQTHARAIIEATRYGNRIEAMIEGYHPEKVRSQHGFWSSFPDFRDPKSKGLAVRLYVPKKLG